MKRDPYLLCYDCSDKSSRAKILRTAQAYSLNPQRSVHQLPISATEVGELWLRVCAESGRDTALMLIKSDTTMQGLRIGSHAQPNPNYISVR